MWRAMPEGCRCKIWRESLFPLPRNSSFFVFPFVCHPRAVDVKHNPGGVLERVLASARVVRPADGGPAEGLRWVEFIQQGDDRCSQVAAFVEHDTMAHDMGVGSAQDRDRRT